MFDVARDPRARWLALLAIAAGIAAVLAQPPVSPAQDGSAARTAIATFAGGCFWCVEEAFEKVPGVISAVSGYTGGILPNPTYEQVSGQTTGHAEAVRVTYDPGKVVYEQLVDWFWRNIDPTHSDGQFCDIGSSYRSAIFVHDGAQRKVAETTKQALQASGRFGLPVVTEISPSGPFYEAEDYHQDYYKKNPNRYRFYKFSCGRMRRLEQLWGTPPPNPMP